MLERNSSLASGEKNFLVILIEFPDLKFTVSSPHQTFDNMLNQPGYTSSSQTGSAFDYFNDNSCGKFTPNFDVVGPVEVSNGYAWYGDDGNGGDRAEDLLIEACGLISNEVDFAKYDNDGDYLVDNVFFFFAGHNEAEGAGTDRIWPHSSNIQYRNILVDGVTLTKFACTSEYMGSQGTDLAGIGTFCHEFSHVLGLPDFYDTDDMVEGLADMDLGTYTIMSDGVYNNNGHTPPYYTAVERELLGWMEIEEWTDEGLKTVEPIENNTAYMTPTANPGEYYVYENRQNNGWDTYTGGHGLIIYHVDKSDNLVGSNTAAYRWSRIDGGINNNASHPCLDLIESVYPASNATDPMDKPFPGSSNATSFNAGTQPAAVDWAGDFTGFGLSGISENGGNVTLTLSIDRQRTLSGTVTDTDGKPVENATVTVSETEVSQSGIRGLSVVKVKAGTEPFSATTDSKGHFELDLTQASSSRLSVKVERFGYADYTEPIIFASGNMTLDIELMDSEDQTAVELRKYNTFNSMTIGWEAGETTQAGARFSSSELSRYAGYKFKSISFVTTTNSATSASVAIDFGKTNVLNFPFPAADLATGMMTTVDISSENITVPEDNSIYISYRLVNPDTDYPVGCDDGPAVEGGCYFYFEGDGWVDYTESIGYNIIISAVLVNPEGKLFYLGVNTIASPKSTYSAGDTFTFALNPSNNTPSSVEWSFDGQPQDTGSVTLTAGTHTVEADLTYGDGYTETLTLELNVQ